IGGSASEDSLAYFRDADQFRNFTLLELPHHGPSPDAAARSPDYATTIVRNFLYSAFALRQWDALQASTDPQVAAIAARSVKELRYHRRHARDWLVRLGDGTAESHDRTQAALEHLFAYTAEFWTATSDEAAAIANGAAADVDMFWADWDSDADDAFAQATLRRPAPHGAPPAGKQGRHSHHLAGLLVEMQSLARQHPAASW
nr:phenylacetate-CoA oxygenase subunit PaaC [Pseudomonadota bacterium]